MVDLVTPRAKHRGGRTKCKRIEHRLLRLNGSPLDGRLEIEVRHAATSEKLDRLNAGGKLGDQVYRRPGRTTKSRVAFQVERTNAMIDSGGQVVDWLLVVG